jgi:hypothetical protein
MRFSFHIWVPGQRPEMTLAGKPVRPQDRILRRINMAVRFAIVVVIRMEYLGK